MKRCVCLFMANACSRCDVTFPVREDGSRHERRPTPTCPQTICFIAILEKSTILNLMASSVSVDTTSVNFLATCKENTHSTSCGEQSSSYFWAFEKMT